MSSMKGEQKQKRPRHCARGLDSFLLPINNDGDDLHSSVYGSSILAVYLSCRHVATRQFAVMLCAASRGHTGKTDAWGTARVTVSIIQRKTEPSLTKGTSWAKRVTGSV